MDQISYNAAKPQIIYDTMDVNWTGWFTSKNKELYSRYVFSNAGLEKGNNEWQVLFCGLSPGIPRNTRFLPQLGHDQ